MTAACASGHRSERHSNIACLKSERSTQRGLGCEHPNFCPPTIQSRCPFKASAWGGGSVCVCMCECVFLSRALPRACYAFQPSNTAELSALTMCLTGLAY